MPHIYQSQKVQSRNLNEEAARFASKIKATHALAKQALEYTASDMEQFYDRTAYPPHEYLPGDLILLKATNICSERPLKKLNNKHYRPFKVIKKVSASAYELKLDSKWCGIHLVFNECLLHPYKKGEFPLQKMPPPPPPIIIPQDEEHEIEDIVNL